jgi:hypothetical protein
MRDFYTYWLCDCCTVMAVNGDPCECHDGEPLDAFVLPDGACGGLVIDDCPACHGDECEREDCDHDGYQSFSWSGCDGCAENADKGGSLHRFVVFVSGGES